MHVFQKDKFVYVLSPVKKKRNVSTVIRFYVKRISLSVDDFIKMIKLSTDKQIDVERNSPQP